MAVGCRRWCLSGVLLLVYVLLLEVSDAARSRGAEIDNVRERRSPQFFNNFDPIPLDEVQDHFGIRNQGNILVMFI